MFNHTPRNIGGMAGITSAVKFLLILNVAVYFIDSFSNPDPRFRFLVNTFALQAHWWEHFEIGNLFTYMFVHGGYMHLLMNMLVLFFIGPTVERTIGSYRFFILYYVSGILGGLGWSLLAKPFFALNEVGQMVLQYPSCVGASGAVMGILGAFGALYPKAQLLLWFIIPIRAWLLVLILAIWELHETITTPVIGGIANAAHLVGGLAGFSYAMTLKHPHLVHQLKSRLSGWKPGSAKPRGRKTPPRNETLSKDEIDRILDKIGREGMGALSPREREMLKKATRG